MLVILRICLKKWEILLLLALISGIGGVSYARLNPIIDYTYIVEIRSVGDKFKFFGDYPKQLESVPVPDRVPMPDVFEEVFTGKKLLFEFLKRFENNKTSDLFVKSKNLDPSRASIVYEHLANLRRIKVVEIRNEDLVTNVYTYESLSKRNGLGWIIPEYIRFVEHILADELIEYSNNYLEGKKQIEITNLARWCFSLKLQVPSFPFESPENDSKEASDVPSICIALGGFVAETAVRTVAKKTEKIEALTANMATALLPPNKENLNLISFNCLLPTCNEVANKKNVTLTAISASLTTLMIFIFYQVWINRSKFD